MQKSCLIPLAALLGAILFAPVSQGKSVSATDKAPIEGQPVAAPAAAKDPAVAVIERWVTGLSQVTLENGLRIVLAPEPDSPTVSVCVTYNVGSRDEGPGQSGFAHLFEHLMFQGSRNVAKGEHFQLVTARGGQLNGSTSTERTNYFETLPDNELELALWLEADRMRWLDVSQENFENQRAVVKEEYRMRVENEAYQPALIELERQVFAGYAPYAHPTIGSMADLDAARLEWVRDFYAKYYRPSNAVLSLSGGFDPDHAVELVRRYFGDIESAPAPELAPPPIGPARMQEQRLELTDANAKTQALLIGWRIPAARTESHYALEMAARVLADGDSSLLYDQLVRKKAWARDVSVYTYDHREVDAFVITVELTEDANAEKVIALLDDELAKLATKGAKPNVLTRARQRTKSAFVMGLQSNQSRATVLGEYATLFRNPRLIARDLDELLRVDSADIARAATEHLRKSGRTLIRVTPAPTPPKAPSAPAPSANANSAAVSEEPHR
jgi:predicted Zn-dependent peptidase